MSILLSRSVHDEQALAPGSMAGAKTADGRKKTYAALRRPRTASPACRLYEAGLPTRAFFTYLGWHANHLKCPLLKEKLSRNEITRATQRAAGLRGQRPAPELFRSGGGTACHPGGGRPAGAFARRTAGCVAVPSRRSE